MPRYEYLCQACQARVDVFRTIHEYEVMPTEVDSSEGEKAECPTPCSSETGHEWKRILTGAPAKAAGPSWGGWGKGSW